MKQVLKDCELETKKDGSNQTVTNYQVQAIPENRLDRFLNVEFLFLNKLKKIGLREASTIPGIGKLRQA